MERLTNKTKQNQIKKAAEDHLSRDHIQEAGTLPSAKQEAMVDLLLLPVRLSIHIRDTHSRYFIRVLRRNICEEKWVLGWDVKDVNCQLVNVAIVNC